jgi:hypothetical protein
VNLKDKQHLEQSMQVEQIREALNTHWPASAAGDANIAEYTDSLHNPMIPT